MKIFTNQNIKPLKILNNNLIKIAHNMFKYNCSKYSPEANYLLMNKYIRQFVSNSNSKRLGTLVKGIYDKLTHGASAEKLIKGYIVSGPVKIVNVKDNLATTFIKDKSNSNKFRLLSNFSNRGHKYIDLDNGTFLVPLPAYSIYGIAVNMEVEVSHILNNIFEYDFYNYQTKLSKQIYKKMN